MVAAVTQGKNFVFIVGGNADVGKLPTVDAKEAVGVVNVCFEPSRAFVVRSVNLSSNDLAGLLVAFTSSWYCIRWRRHVAVVDKGINDIRIGKRDVEADTTQRSRGQAVGKFGPRLTSVDAFIDPTSEAAFVGGTTHCLPSGSVENVAIPWIDRHLDRPSTFAYIEGFAPGLPTICRLEDASLFIRRPKMADGSDVNGFGVVGVNDDFSDVMSVLQTHVLPGFACIFRLEYSGTSERIAAVAWLSLPSPDP